MTELVVLRAEDESHLVAEMNRLLAFLDRVSDVQLADVAYTAALTRGSAAIAIIAADAAELRERLASAVRRIAGGNVRRIRDKSGTYYFREHLLGEGRGKLAFLYPGVMSFYPDMLRDLVIAQPTCRRAFDELEEALVGDPDFTPSSFVFPPAAYYRHDADIFSSGAYAQALVSTYAGCMGMTRLLAELGLNPHGVVGFAGGDLAAMMCSGAAGAKADRPSRVKVIRDIYQIVHQAVNHGGFEKVAMLTVRLRDPGEIDELMRAFPPDQCRLVVDFSPRQKTYAVKLEAEPVVSAALAAAGIRTMKLALDRPFNTPLCESLVPAVRKFLLGWMKFEPVYDVYSCATAAKVPAGLKAAREDTAGRWARPVLLGSTIRQMFADGYRVFLEVGPRGLMTAAVSDTLKGEEYAAIALNSIHRRGILQLQHAIGQLVALGADIDVARALAAKQAKRLDFDSALSLEVRRDAERRLSRAFPKLTFLSAATPIESMAFLAEPKGRGARAQERLAARAQRQRRQRQFDFGAINPLVSDADTLDSSLGVAEITKTFKLSEYPFIGDYALGTSQLSYSDPNLKGLILLSLPIGAEIMAEVASMVKPNQTILRIEELNCRRRIAFAKGELKLFVRAELVAPAKPGESAVKVQLRDDAPNSAYTWPAMEVTVVLGDALPPPRPLAVEPMCKPRSVHWAGREIYPLRLCWGARLRSIQFVEAWSESGLDYEIVVPPLAGNVTSTRFPIWKLNPLFLEAVVSGFALWRSHERFTGAFSFPFRLRRLEVNGIVPEEGLKLKCYLRLVGVTPKSQISDIVVSDGNGMTLMTFAGWEELTERVPNEYRQLILQPAMTYLTQSLGSELIGHPVADVASAFITDVPYATFERNEELWLKTLSRVVLDASERREFDELTGSTARRTEWLFGRVTAKEAVRRFLSEFYQARWSSADIRIWPDDSGKPHALGAWNDYLSTKLDIAIAHTAQFVVAVAAANCRVGVDCESMQRDLSDDFAAGVFTQEERELAAGAASSFGAIIKFWCAKEAVSKALGTGIRYSPREMVVKDFQSDSGILTLQLEGAWVEAFRNFRGRDIAVTVKVVRDHALATCFIPNGLFADE